MTLHAHTLVALAASASLGLVGCTALLPYAEGMEDCANHRDDDLDGLIDCADRDSCGGEPACNETSMANCHDTIDQDDDMLLDCEDPDCDGYCTEDDRLRCANGRDDDGDGYEDGTDPSCWSFGTVEITRCIAFDPVSETIAPQLASWWVDPTAGAAIEVDDPVRSGSRALRGADGQVNLDSRRTWPGPWDGTSVRTRLYLTPDATLAVLEIGPLEVALSPGTGVDATLLASLSGADGHQARLVDATSEWWTVTAAFARDARGRVQIQIDAVADGGTRAHLEFADDGWAVSGDLTFLAQLGTSVGGATALLGEVSVTRSVGRSCDDGFSPAIGSVLGVAERPGGPPCSSGEFPCAAGRWCQDGLCVDPVLCIVGESGSLTTPTGPTVWHRDASGLVARDASWPSALVLPPAPAWDPVARRFVGVSTDSTGAPLLVASDDDCDTWRIVGPALAIDDPELHVPLVAGLDQPDYMAEYSVTRAQPTRPALHEIGIATRHEGQRGVMFATSETGAASSFTRSRFVSLEPVLLVPAFWSSEDWLWTAQISARTIGDEHVFVVNRFERTPPAEGTWVTRVYVELADGSLRELANAVIPGGVDHGALFVETPDPRGIGALLFYEIAALPASHRYDVATLSIGPAATCASPIPETCNTLDDDCDGVIDEGCP